MKKLTANEGDLGEFDPWVRKISWHRKWQPVPVSLPGKSPGQRSLASYSLRGYKELDMTECTHIHTHTFHFNLQFVFYNFIIKIKDVSEL